VPDLFEILEGVPARTGGVSDGSGIEPPSHRYLLTKIDVLRSAVVRVASQFIDAEPEARVPFDPAGARVSAVSLKYEEPNRRAPPTAIGSVYE
jgi:hypothetical protein